MNVHDAIRRADEILPGEAAPEGEVDPRWQSIIAVGNYIERSPKAVWAFAERWANHEDDDLRSAVATCLLEHLLEHHFDLLFGRVEKAAHEDRLFADTLRRCAKFGHASKKRNAERIDRLLEETAE